MENIIDIFIIGGGINGTAIAADAAGRGLSVVLCEKADFASETSSASTKLIHGGLRYLEQYQINVVKKALNEREILLQRAPHLIHPLEFILPHESRFRPAWFVRLGLFLYDHLAKKSSLPRSKMLSLKKNSRGDALVPSFKRGFSYYDCFTNDARLTILNAISAKEKGATLLTHTTFISAHREGNLWRIRLRNNKSLNEFFYYSKALINAAGPWIREIQEKIIDSPHFIKIKLSKGSHIIVPKLYEGNFAYILQNDDHRIIFTVPFEENFTLIGTTDIELSNPISHIKITEEEKKYLLEITNHYFKKKITIDDITESYSGIRCLQTSSEKDPSRITREYSLLVDTTAENTLPLLTVIGGKITTHRLLAESVMDKLKIFFPNVGKEWTANCPLPGGNIENKDIVSFHQKIKNQFSWLPDELIDRYIKTYGTRLYLFLKNTTCLADLGIEFAAGLYQKEVEYLIEHEWAQSSDDILWRRTKLGLYFSKDDIKKLDDWLTKT